jgi:hypothetical protein
MSDPFAHIARCVDLQERDLSEAVASRATTKALLLHLSGVCAPNTGAAKVLLVFSRMATSACGWIDGELCVDVSAEGERTIVECSTELGGGLRERILPALAFRAPIGEFLRAIDRVPHAIAPLSMRARSPTRISLSATEGLRRTTVPPPPIEISSDSLFVGTPAQVSAIESAVPSLPPDHDVDTGWDD